ncbi:MAG: hypothetical protein CBE17_00625 [Gammaproteobacteria bacterium TMED257]|nr:MAG: hypothetical protein CBE17_00625 [Gammaproteobacteria bacterium TMED257]
MSLFSGLLDKFTSKSQAVDDIKLDKVDDEIALSTCILLIEVSKSDDAFDESEKNKIIDIIKNKFSLDDNQMTFLLEIADKKNNDMISLYEWTSSINESYNYDQKKDLIKLLWEVAYADGRIDKYEDYTIRKISELLYVKHTDFIRMKLS